MQSFRHLYKPPSVLGLGVVAADQQGRGRAYALLLMAEHCLHTSRYAASCTNLCTNDLESDGVRLYGLRFGQAT